jgi:hypothetical protein
MNLAEAYHTLEVPPNAHADQVRAAYRRLALAHHPDRNGNSRESLMHFNRVTRAYRLLHAERAALGCPRCGGPLGEEAGQARNRQEDACRSCQAPGAGRQMLPGLAAVVVRCTGAGALLGLALGCLLALLRGGAVVWGLAAVGTSGLAIGWLALMALRYPEAAFRSSRRRR